MEKLDLSVIIYACNCETALPACLSHLEEQTFPTARFELIVIEDGSTDRTLEILENYVLGAAIAVHILRLDGVGVARAQNIAAEAALGRWLLFLEVDLLPGRLLVEKHVHAQEAFASQCAIIGNVTLHRHMNPNSFTRWIMPESQYDLPQDRPLEPWEWRGANLSLPRKILLEAGGIKEDLPFPVYDDVELGWRLGKSGVEGRFIHDAQAHVWRAAKFTEERKRQYAKGYTLHSLIPLIGVPQSMHHYQLNSAYTWRQWFESLYMPHYAKTCAHADPDSPLFNRFFRRVLRYDLRRGFHDAQHGRRPREDKEVL